MATTARERTDAKGNGKTETKSDARTTDARKSVGPRTFPAPPHESTPTDLSREQVKRITEAVNPLIADAFALYVKTKNFHWHVSGPRFRDLHLLFDEHADQIFESIDIMAERIRRIGGTTIRSIDHINRLQTIDDDNNEFVAPDAMVARLLADNQHMARQQRAAIEVCSDNDDEATSNRLQEIIDGTERRIWFLYEISQTGPHER